MKDQEESQVQLGLHGTRKALIVCPNLNLNQLWVTSQLWSASYGQKGWTKSALFCFPSCPHLPVI